MSHPDKYRDSFIALGQYLVSKQANAEGTVEVEDGVVLWALRQGDTTDFQCAVLETDIDRHSYIKLKYEKIKETGKQFATPYTIEEIETFEKYHDIKVPSLLRFYLLEISREIVFSDNITKCFELNMDSPFKENTFIREEHIKSSSIKDTNISITDGSIVFADSSELLIVKGNGYGYILKKIAPNEYAILTLWEALNRIFMS